MASGVPYPWMHTGQTPERIGLDGYPLFPDDPLRAAHRALNEFLDASFEKYMATIHAAREEIERGGDPGHSTERYRAQRKAEDAATRAFLDARIEDHVALFRAALTRLLWSTQERYGWVERCDALEAMRRRLPREVQAFHFVQFHLPEGETLEWRNELKFDDVVLYAFVSPRQLLLGHASSHRFDLGRIVDQLLRRKVAWSEEDLLQMLAAPEVAMGTAILSRASVLRVVERHIAAQEMSAPLRSAHEQARSELDRRYATARERRLARRIGMILGVIAPPALLEPGERWAQAAGADLARMDVKDRAAWSALLEHVRTGGNGRPSERWLRKARSLIEPIGGDRFRSRVASWVTLVGLPGAGPSGGDLRRSDDATLLSEQSAAQLRGLACCLGLFADREACRALGALAEASFSKVPGIGPRSARVGNACLHALGTMPGPEPVAWLIRLRARIRNAPARRRVEHALVTAARQAGLSPEELEEVAVPDFGLEAGCLRQAVGGYTAEVRIVSSRAVETRWHRQDDTPCKGIPALVRREHATELAALKQVTRDIARMLPAQRDRLERLWLDERTWPFPSWRQRYLDHPLLAPLARRLIWQFVRGNTTCLGAWLDGRVVDGTDRPLEGLDGATAVRLWHPIDSDPQVVLRWRAWLEGHRITQPFKQAHREVYVVTDAERRTRTYSNRFAAHVLKQHQLAALCRERGWSYALQGDFDAHNVPRLSLSRQNLRAEFWIDTVTDREQRSPAGIYLYVTTDQVRFYRVGEADPLPLEEVPPLIFTEVMRDVDLFVGVASVGNDPNWSDGGPAGRHVDYWQSYSFGELSATAQTRKAVLERLIPRLKISGRCSFSGRFLVVQGDLGHTGFTSAAAIS